MKAINQRAKKVMDLLTEGVIISRRTGKPAFKSEFNADAVEQLRRHHMTREASK